MFELVELVASLDVKLVKWLMKNAKKFVYLSNTELLILWRVYKRNKWKISDLSNEMGIPPSTLTGIFDRLENQGLIERKHDHADRRSIHIDGTEKLDNIIDQWKSSVNYEMEKFSSGLPEGLLERLKQDLTELKDYFSKNEGA